MIILSACPKSLPTVRGVISPVCWNNKRDSDDFLYNKSSAEPKTIIKKRESLNGTKAVMKSYLPLKDTSYLYHWYCQFNAK